VVMITGAQGAIGASIARLIASYKAHVIVVGRDAKRGDKLCASLKESTRNQNIESMTVDLSLKSAIVAFAQKFKASGKPLHVLVNNHAIAPDDRRTTSEGIEMQWATNVLSYHWLSVCLRDCLAQSARDSKMSSRIVNVASNYAGGLKLSDVEFKQRDYENNAAYRQSKQANRMLSTAFAKLVKTDNIMVNACHPGVVTSQLSGDLGFSGPDSSDEGAATPVWLACAETGGSNTGLYYHKMSESKCQFSGNKKDVDELWDFVDKTYPLPASSSSSSSSSSSPSPSSSSSSESSSSSSSSASSL